MPPKCCEKVRRNSFRISVHIARKNSIWAGLRLRLILVITKSCRSVHLDGCPKVPTPGRLDASSIKDIETEAGCDCNCKCGSIRFVTVTAYIGWGAPAIEAEAHCGEEDALLLLARLFQTIVNQVQLVAVGAGLFGRQQPRFLGGAELQMRPGHTLYTSLFRCTQVDLVPILTGCY